jgi:prephenate dehydrogenase
LHHRSELVIFCGAEDDGGVVVRQINGRINKKQVYRAERSQSSQATKTFSGKFDKPTALTRIFACDDVVIHSLTDNMH